MQVLAPSAASTTTAATATTSVALGSNAANNVSTLGMLRGVFLREGVSGLYRGVTAPLIAVTPAFAVSFWSYDLGCRVLRDDSDGSKPLSIGQVSLAGAWSGIPLAMIFGPSERVKCLMQVNKGPKYSTFARSLQTVYQEGGLKSVFRGTWSTVLRDVPGNAMYFSVYGKKLHWFIDEGRSRHSLLSHQFVNHFVKPDHRICQTLHLYLRRPFLPTSRRILWWYPASRWLCGCW